MRTSSIIAVCAGALIMTGIYPSSMIEVGRIWACLTGISLMLIAYVIGNLEERN